MHAMTTMTMPNPATSADIATWSCSLPAVGIGLYGGGQFELGPGRGHIQLLASLFHPNGPNDVAPGGYNGAPVPGLPTSPLRLAGQPGFRA